MGGRREEQIYFFKEKSDSIALQTDDFSIQIVLCQMNQ